MNDKKTIILFPESHRHLGLLDDLRNQPKVQLICTEQKKIRCKFLTIIKKLHTTPVINHRLRLPNKRIWYKDIALDIPDTEETCLIVFDAALRALKPETANKIFQKRNVHANLLLINAMNAHSAGMLDVIPLMIKFDWEHIFTFDPRDAEAYGFQPLAFCYYSQKPASKLADDTLPPSGAYFIGGSKGSRGRLLTEVFEKLDQNGVTADFNILLTGFQRLGRHPHEDKIHYRKNGWIPYEDVLRATLRTNVIVEILQEGQRGPSLRYFEAVCYNKKLLTNNPEIKSFPFYRPEYMKIIASADDIDIEWVKETTEVDYGYRGEFSPVHLPDFIQKKQGTDSKA